MVTLRMELDYTWSGTSVTAVNRYAALVVKNINQLVTITLSSNNAYVSNGVAYHIATWAYKLGPIDDLSVQIGTAQGTLTGTYSGYSWTWGKL